MLEETHFGGVVKASHVPSWQRLVGGAALAMKNVVLDGFAWCCFRREPGPAERIVVFRSSAIGDFICCLPALTHIRRSHPAARIHLLTMASATRKYRGDSRFVAGATVLGDSSVIDEIHLLDNARLTSPSYFREMRASMRELNPDRVVVLPQTGASLLSMLKKLLFLRALGLKRNVSGYRTRQISFLRKTQFGMGLYEHQVVTAMRAAGAVANEPVEFAVSRSEETCKAVDRHWQEHGLDGSRDMISLFVGAKFDHKRWPLEDFTELSRRIVQQLHVPLVLIGGPQEARLAECLQSAAMVPVVNLAGKLELLETAEVLRRCRMHIGNDSGPAHLAAAVGTPCVTITSGIMFPGVWEPWGAQHITIRRRVPCEYCFGEDHCPSGTMECIRGITVDEVWNAVLTLWSRVATAK